LQGVEKTLEEDGAVRETQMEMVFTIIVERGEEVQCSAVQCCAVSCHSVKKHHLTTQQQALIKASNGSS
jgi:hypothetical protein